MSRPVFSVCAVRARRPDEASFSANAVSSYVGSAPTLTGARRKAKRYFDANPEAFVFIAGFDGILPAHPVQGPHS